MQKELTTNELDDINNIVDLEKLKEEILKKHGSYYAYAKTFEIHEGDLSSFIHKKRPLTLRQIIKHAKNLKMRVRLNIEAH